jgi:hypothetical protein
LCAAARAGSAGGAQETLLMLMRSSGRNLHDLYKD